MSTINQTHDADLTSWVVGANSHPDFPIQNLPFGIFDPEDSDPRGGVAIGNSILDLRALAGSGLLNGRALGAAESASGVTLNPLLALNGDDRSALRQRLSELLALGSDARGEVEPFLYNASDCRMHLPARIGDYTDFYVGIHHATNVGKIFRPDSPLLPNYKHVPIGYHGRASSIRVSGTDVRRPNGQQKRLDEAAPVFGPSVRLDYELEMGVWIGGSNELGEPIPIGEASQHIAGLCLLNDWSARDLQAWECGHPTITVASILPGQRNDVLSQRLFVICPTRHFTLRRPMLPEHATHPSLGYVQHPFHLVNAASAPRGA